MKNILKYILTFFFLFACIAVYPRSYSFRGLSLTEGLSDLVVNAIYKDSLGYVWIGTGNSLERFDGIHIKHYLIVGDDEKLKRFQKANAVWAKGKCNSFFSCKEYLEYCPVDTDKGTGAQYLVKLLNIPHTSTVAIGDEQNDIPMIQSAHIGIAMKNGIDDIKKTADYVTENDNNHDAIAEVIEKFIL